MHAANELLFHKCRYNRKINFSYKSEKNAQIQLLSFYFINAERKIIFLFQIRKNVQIQPMSFYYINVETKIIKLFTFQNLKKFTSPTIEFPLRKCRHKRDFF